MVSESTAKCFLSRRNLLKNLTSFRADRSTGRGVLMDEGGILLSRFTYLLEAFAQISGFFSFKASLRKDVGFYII